MPNPPAGRPVIGYEDALRLAGYTTRKMMDLERREPGPDAKPAACYWTGYEYADLWRIDQVVDKPPLSPGRQRIYERNRTCARCAATRRACFEVGAGGLRFCPACLEPAAKEAWEKAHAADRPVVSRWAAGVIADEQVVLVACRTVMYGVEVRIEDLAGAVLVDALVRPKQPDGFRVTHGKDDAHAVDAAALDGPLAELAGRRGVSWWPTTTLHGPDRALRLPPTADDDHFGRYYTRWVGKIASPTYRSAEQYPRWLLQVPPPWNFTEQLATIRAGLHEMAAGPIAG